MNANGSGVILFQFLPAYYIKLALFPARFDFDFRAGRLGQYIEFGSEFNWDFDRDNKFYAECMPGCDIKDSALPEVYNIKYKQLNFNQLLMIYW